MNKRKQFTRVLFFVFLLACLLTGLAGINRAPVLAAPQRQAAALSVVINEIGWAGTAVNANHEWIELYNSTGSPMPLTGWRLTDNGNIDIPLSGSIPANGFFLLERTSDNTISDIPADQTYTGGLVDTGESLFLYDNFGNLIDSANADGGAWPAGLAPPNRNSMERVNPLAPDSDLNWATNNGVIRNGLDANSNPINGTPKQLNSATSALTATISPTVTVTPSLTLSPTNTVSPTNTPSPTNTAPTATIGTAFPARTVLINEVAWMGTIASTADEWIELHNPGSTPIDLTRWTLQSTDLSPNIPLSGTIPPNGYYLLERTDDTTVSDIVADLTYSGELNNTGEVLLLIDPAGGVVDTANGNGGAWPAGSSATFGSMERRGVIADSDTAWITNTGLVRNGLDANGGLIRGTPKNRNWAFSVTPTVSLTPTRTRTATPIPTITRTPTPLPPPPLLVINEFVPRPGHDWNGDGAVNEGDEYIEILNHGVVDVNLSGHTLDDEVNIGSNPYVLPAITLKPGERRAFFESETGLRLSDGGDGVRLLKPNGQLFDAYNYRVVRAPDHAYCRYPDNGGADDWNTNCFPTPGRQNSLSGSAAPPPEEELPVDTACPLSDTQPDDFVWAECQPFGQNIFRPAFWDRTGWFGERYLPESPGKWPVFAD